MKTGDLIFVPESVKFAGSKECCVYVSRASVKWDPAYVAYTLLTSEGVMLRAVVHRAKSLKLVQKYRGDV